MRRLRRILIAAIVAAGLAAIGLAVQAGSDQLTATGGTIISQS